MSVKVITLITLIFTFISINANSEHSTEEFCKKMQLLRNNIIDDYVELDLIEDEYKMPQDWYKLKEYLISIQEFSNLYIQICQDWDIKDTFQEIGLTHGG